MTEALIVLDASVVLAWGFADEYSEYARLTFEALERKQGVVPPIWPMEVANALLVAERRGRMTPAATHEFLGLLEDLGIYVEEGPPGYIWDTVLNLAREHNLSVYDASYLELASRLKAPLATQDHRLQQVAQTLGLLFMPFPQE